MTSTMLSQDLFSVSCPERRGTRERTVRRVDLAVHDVLFIQNKLRGLPSMFSLVPMTDAKPIWRAIDAGWDFLAVDDVGLLGIGRTYHNALIDVHISFWDQVLRGREQLCRQAAEYARQLREAEGVYTAIPVSAKATIAFAKRVGFEVAEYFIGAAVDRRGEKDDAVTMVL